MRLSMEHYLRHVLPFMPAELLSPQALEPILGLARKLPPCASSGFELRLGDEAPVADFLVNILTDDGSRTTFAGRHPDIQPPASFRQSPVWQRVRDFCRLWSEPEEPLYSRVRDLWLEFDLEQFSADIPIPGVFFGPRWESAELLGTVDRCVSLLRGPELARPPALSRCLELMPGRRRLEQVGMMFSRYSEDLRLCLRDIPPREMSGYLSRAGWSGRPEEFDAIVEDLLPFVDDITLDIDVGDGVRPKIGLECILDRNPSKERWGAWLEHLVDQKLCTPRKRDGLLAWMGVTTQRDQPESWPENLVQFSQRTPGMLSTFARRVNHLKLVHQPGQPLQVKAYLAVRHIWFRVTSSTSAV
jgi:hypothetical protein